MRAHRAAAGLTLVELLVALGALALMALLSWRGIDAMVRSDEALRTLARQAQVLDAAIGQWQADLDAALALPGLPEMDWDGQVWRVIRRDPVDPGRGVMVVAWALRAEEGASASVVWTRWQAGPWRTREQVRLAWAQAAMWARQDLRDSVGASAQLIPVAAWQLSFFTQGRWGPALTTPVDAVRLQIRLPADTSAGGPVTVDWLSPRVAGTQP